VSARQHAGARGFTLIEVLVALAIVTLGMAALLGTLSSAANTSAYLQDKTLAEWIALNQVSKVRLSSQAPSKGDSDGEIDYAGRKWKWTQKVDDMQIQGVLSVVVKVRPADVAASAAPSSLRSRVYSEGISLARRRRPSSGRNSTIGVVGT